MQILRWKGKNCEYYNKIREYAAKNYFKCKLSLFILANA